MLPLHLLDDDTVEALLAGRPVTPGLAPLAGAVGAIRAAARQPVRPSAELAQRMASGDFTGISPAPLPAPAGRRLRSWLSGVSPRVRVVTGAVVLFTGLTAATATGALPGPAQARMETLIETVTPISFQDDQPTPDVVDIRDTEPDRGRTPATDPGESPTPADPGPPVTTPPGKPETPPGKPETPGNPDKPENTPPGKPESPPGRPDRPETPRPDNPGQGNEGNNGDNGNGGGANGNSQGNSGNGNSGNGLGQGNGGVGNENGNGGGNSADRPNGPDR